MSRPKTTLNNLKDIAKKEVETCEIMIGFYEHLAKNMSKEDAANTMLKAQKIQDSLKFNKALNDYLQSL